LEKNLEEVRKIGIIAATLGLKIGEILKLCSDHQCEVHHFSLSDTVTVFSAWVFEAFDWNQWMVLDSVKENNFVSSIYIILYYMRLIVLFNCIYS